MREATHDVVLRGCTPEPLMSYLKALGILRLVAEDREHGDPAARGFWRDDVFVLRSQLDEGSLETFFLQHYRPTPIVAPWAGGSGFFPNDNTDAVEALGKGGGARVDRYREAITLVRKIVSEEKIDEKPKDEEKVRLLQRYRRDLPDAVVAWMDAAMVLQQDGQSFAPILGTGGNDGRLDFTQNFMQRLVLLGVHRDTPAEQSSDWLGQSLFAKPSRMNSASVGQFAPGRAGGPNATQGMQGDSADNPWDFVLMLEGSLVLAGAAVRRLGTSNTGRAAFPFTVRAADVGFASAGRDESAESRGELWMPLWNRPTSLAELAVLFGEGRAEVHGRPVRDAVSFARAAASLGVDRGIATFCRVTLLKRSGKAFLATPAGRFVVTERPAADLLREIDPWLDAFRQACSAENVPARFAAALRAIDAAVFDFCRYCGAAHFADILVALGRAEREMALTPGKIGKSSVGPIAGLSFDWVRAAAGIGDATDDTPLDLAPLEPEFQIALALAGIRAADGEHERVGPLRSNLEPISTWFDTDEQRTQAKWAEKDRAVVWNSADLSANLAAVLARRVMDAGRLGCENLPLAPGRDMLSASPNTIASFLRGELDDRRIQDLLWGSILVDPPRGHQRGQKRDRVDVDVLPSIYCLLKVLFLPKPLVPEDNRADAQGGRKVRWRLARRVQDGPHKGKWEDGLRIRPEPAILALLRSGRVGEAATIAMRRLRASGLKPLPHRRFGGPLRDNVWTAVRLSARDGWRLAAALLIPIDPNAVDALVHRATRGDDFEMNNDDPSTDADGHGESHAARAAASTINSQES